MKIGYPAGNSVEQQLEAIIRALNSLDDNNVASGFGFVPKGGIIAWRGASTSVPDGWALCNGQNGTPDLRDKFIIGATGSYSKGTTGGEATHTLSTAEMPAHNHSVDPPATNTDSKGAHSHQLKFADLTDASTGQLVPRYYPDSGTPFTGTDSVGAHTHSVNISAFNSASTGSGTAHNNLPPYYALAFIMRIK